MKNKMGRAHSTYDGEERCLQGFMLKFEEKRPGPRLRREHFIKTNLRGRIVGNLDKDSDKWWSLVHHLFYVVKSALVHSTLLWCVTLLITG
jgi:hypothetical protein